MNSALFCVRGIFWLLLRTIPKSIKFKTSWGWAAPSSVPTWLAKTAELKRVPIKTYILNKSNHNLDKQTPKQKGRTFSKSPVHADFETVLNLIHSYNISRYIYEKVWGWKKLTFKFSMNLTLFGNDERVDVPCLFIKYCSIFEFLLRENCYDVKIK